MPGNFGQDESQILKNFRHFTKSHINQFLAERDRIVDLLGPSQRYPSGIFREGLMREFLEKISPSSVSVNSGFIYGFEVESSSKQLDIVIWDSSRYGTIYRTKEYVIVPPESAIAVVSVKSNMSLDDIRKGLDNIDSVIELDRKYRRSRLNKETKLPIFRPIQKYLVSYSPPDVPTSVGETISSHYRELIGRNQEYANEIIASLATIIPMVPQSDIKDTISTIVLNMCFSIEVPDASFFVGWGPPQDLMAEKTYGPSKLKRLPFLYRQDNRVTTQLDKFAFSILSVVNDYYGTPGWSLTAAWADIHPTFGFRMGDAAEIAEAENWPLVDAETLVYREKERKPLVPEGWQ